ncbi:putative citronellol/citronellal dehydrogenase AtuB [Chytriomyces sp. MP71]|nr:putative citronellol/citronellal dehydrogenase AtuB [Chytriomyces sp. MP71]
MSKPEGVFHSIYRKDLFSGQRILITGGGTGIGRCTAHELASIGAHVIIAGRKESNLQQVAREIRSIPGQRCDFVQMDVRNVVSVNEAVVKIVEQWGFLSGLVNNAGGQFPSPAENISDKGWRSVIDLNLNGTWNVIKAVHSHHDASRGPLSIVTVTADVRNGKLFMAHTAAARAGIENLTKTLSQEWGSQGVRINCVAPGTILGNGISSYAKEVKEQTAETHFMNPAGRLGTEAEISSAITYLLSPGASFVTGCVIQATGGAHLRKGFEDVFIPYQAESAIPPYFGFRSIDSMLEPAYFASGKIPSGFESLIADYTKKPSKL